MQRINLSAGLQIPRCVSARVSVNLFVSASSFISLTSYSVKRFHGLCLSNCFKQGVDQCLNPYIAYYVKFVLFLPVVGFGERVDGLTLTLPIVSQTVSAFCSFCGVSGSVSFIASAFPLASVTLSILSFAYAKVLYRVSSSTTTSASPSWSQTLSPYASARLSPSLLNSSSVYTSPSVSPCV